MADGDEEGQNTLELPPEILENGSRVGSLGASSLATGFGSAREKSLFNSDPTKTLSAIQRELEGKCQGPICGDFKLLLETQIYYLLTQDCTIYLIRRWLY